MILSSSNTWLLFLLTNKAFQYQLGNTDVLIVWRFLFRMMSKDPYLDHLNVFWPISQGSSWLTRHMKSVKMQKTSMGLTAYVDYYTFNLKINFLLLCCSKQPVQLVFLFLLSQHKSTHNMNQPSELIMLSKKKLEMYNCVHLRQSYLLGIYKVVFRMN